MSDLPPPPSSIYVAKSWPEPADMPVLGVGVRGLAFNDGETIWIGWMHSDPRFSGNGGAYLDALPKDKRVVVINVISIVLVGMLRRRGFHLERRLFTVRGEAIEGFVRESA